MPIPVDLVYFVGCPHVEAARRALRAALDSAPGAGAWREWRTDDPALPGYAKGYGSPSIFVAGREVTGCAPTANAHSCRVYMSARDGFVGTPDAESIAAAVREAAE